LVLFVRKVHYLLVLLSIPFHQLVHQLLVLQMYLLVLMVLSDLAVLGFHCLLSILFVHFFLEVLDVQFLQWLLVYRVVHVLLSLPYLHVVLLLQLLLFLPVILAFLGHLEDR
jgi:signal transduction histidine kinase